MYKKLLARVMIACIFVTYMPTFAFATEGEITGGTSVQSEQTIDDNGPAPSDTPEAAVTPQADKAKADVTAPAKAAPSGAGDDKVTAVTIDGHGYDTLTEAAAAAVNGNVIEINEAGTYKIPNLSQNVKVKATVEGVVFDCNGSGSIASIPNGATFENVTMNFGTSAYHGFLHAGTIDMKECTLNGLLFTYGDMNFTKCTFNAPGTAESGASSSDYMMWAYSGDITFTECTLNGAGKLLHVYNEGAAESFGVTLDKCSFHSTKSNKAAVNVKETCGNKALKYNVSIKNCTADENFPAAKEDGVLKVISPLVQVDDRLSQPTADGGDITVAVDGKTVYSTPGTAKVAKIGDKSYTSLQEALNDAVASKSDVTVEIIDDIDLADTEWTSVNLNGNQNVITVGGNSHVITGLNERLFGTAWASKGLVINNLTIKDSNIVSDEQDSKGDVGVGAFVGYIEATQTVSLNNCHVIDSTVSGGHWAGGLVGICGGYNNANDGPVFTTLSINGCSVKGCTIKSKGSTGAMIGHGAMNAATKVILDGAATGNTIAGASASKTGRVIGTIGAGGPEAFNGEKGGIVLNVVESGNTGAANVAGRIATAGGTMIITGGSYASDPLVTSDNSTGTIAVKEGYRIAEKDGAFVVAEQEYPVQIVDDKYLSLADAVAAAKSGDVIEIKAAGTYKIPNLPQNVTVKGVVEGVVFDCTGSGSIASVPNGATFENVTMNFGANNYHGFQHAGTIDMRDCTLNGLLFSYGNMNFDGCTFNAPGSDYSMWAYGMDITYKDCTFNGAGKFVNVYNEGGQFYSIKAEGCTFNSTKTNKAAFNVKETCGSTVLNRSVEIKDCTCNENFPAAKEDGVLKVISPLVQVDDRLLKGTKNGGEIKVSIDDKEVYSTPKAVVVAKIGDEEYSELADALQAAVAKKGDVTVEIIRDIDLKGQEWPEILVDGAKGVGKLTIKGNNHTIKGLTAPLIAGTWAGKSSLSILNLTIADSAIVKDAGDSAGTVGVGAFVGYPQASASIILENCHLKNSSVTGGHWTGGLIGIAGGYAGSDGPVHMNLVIAHCSVEGSTISGNGSVGGIIGHAANDTNTNVTISSTWINDNTITSTGSSKIKAGIVMGTVGIAPVMVSIQDEHNNKVTSGGASIDRIYGRFGQEGSTLQIFGGNYSSTGSSFVAPEVASTLLISGGTFAKEPPAEFIMEGYKAVKQGDVYVIAKKDYVAQVGSKKYESLAEAVAAANGETVSLLKDCAGDGIVVKSGNVVIDFAGHTYTVDSTVGSAGTKTIGFQLLKDATVTLKNGTLTSETAKMLIQNYADLTLEGMTVDGSKLAAAKPNNYTVSNNNGKIAFTKGTKIIAKDGGVAYDLYDWATAGYEGISLTMDDDVVISGTVEVGGDRDVLDITVKAAAKLIPDAPADYKWVDAGDGAVKLAKKDYVAQIGDKKYESLAEAVAAAKNGEVIEYLAEDGSTLAAIGYTDMSFFGMTFNAILDIQSTKDGYVIPGTVLADLFEAGAAKASNSVQVYITGDITIDAAGYTESDNLAAKEHKLAVTGDEKGAGKLTLLGTAADKFPVEVSMTEDKGTVTKSAELNVNIPKDYSWSEAKDGMQTMQKHVLKATAAKDATCTEDGNIAYWTCADCDKIFKDAAAAEEIAEADTVIAKLGHAWDEGTVTTEPTCTKKGVKTFKCSRCEDTKTEEIAANGHDFVSHDAVEATCTEAGNVKYMTCKNCDKFFYSNGDETPWSGIVVKALGHKAVEHAAVDPACTKDGNIKYWTCERCDKFFADADCTKEITEADTVAAALGHDYVDGICSRCGDKRFVSAVIDGEEIGFESIEAAVKAGAGRTMDTPIKIEVDGAEYTLADDETLYLNLNGKEVDIKAEDGAAVDKEELDGITIFSVLDSDIFNDSDDIRIAGANRYDTAIDVAEKLKISENVDSFKCIVVACGDNYPDALTGGYLARVNNAPLILVTPSQESRIAKYIQDNLDENGKVYILGGTGAVSGAFEDKCKAITSNVKRLGGKDRYETNIRILEEAGVNTEDLLICSGTGYADSLSASAVGKPIFLVGASLTAEQKTYLGGLNTAKYYAIGGTGAVSDSVFEAVWGIRPGADKQRVFGMNRYETSAEVALQFFPKGTADTVTFAYAQNFPDGLAGSALALSLKAPLLLTDNSSTAIAAIQKYVKDAGIIYSVTLGGQTLISDAARNQILGK